MHQITKLAISGLPAVLGAAGAAIVAVTYDWLHLTLADPVCDCLSKPTKACF